MIKSKACSCADTDYVIHFLRIQACFGTEGKCFRNCNSIDLNEHVVDQLHSEALADLPNVKNVRRHRFKVRPPTFDGIVVTADNN